MLWGVVQPAAAEREKGKPKTAVEGEEEEEEVGASIRETCGRLAGAGFALAFLPFCVAMVSA